MSDESVASAHDESSAPVTATSTETTICPFCAIHLAFPSGSALIQCPQCSNTLDPRNASHQIRCVGCQCLLAFPPNSLYIQCPKCLNTMDPRQPSKSSSNTNTSNTSSSLGNFNPSGGLHNIPRPNEPISSKKRRDPNMPKAVCNAYMVFCKTRRNELKYENPDLPFGKIGAKLGEIWRNMTNDEKRPYEDRAAIDRERYRREMLEYQSGKKKQKTKSNGGSSSMAYHHSGDENDENDDAVGEYDDDSGEYHKSPSHSKKLNANGTHRRAGDKEEEEDYGHEEEED